MKILGIDTSTRFLCIGIYDGSRIYEYNLDLNRNLSALLTPTINRILNALGWQASDIDYFACGLGPGSFTGMRVGIAAIKGLAFSLNKPVVGIPTLDILAKNASIHGAYVIPVVDAKRNLIYTSIYRNKDAGVKRIKPYMLLTADEFIKKAKIKGEAVILGDAVNLYKQKLLAGMKRIMILDKDYWYPRAGNIINLAIERIKDKKINNAFDIEPIYLYPKECQVRK
ncbi:MAG: tRNA (adenosine(37)-N6)-threonylcarbamoyltransferase complex dimerization subunit type 1 TsaB [Candidatus Omnitrophica bacterium]|nr:tRNA (adenosine(37)-N6)-threonylcarbamoyltransferase complex dimerization subunit type 1 TsaB [Candidatus Omnitrophota bacterium]